MLQQVFTKSVKPKVLVITPRFPYPVIGGDKLRIYEICKELSKHFDLTLLSLCDQDSDLKFKPPNDGVFISIHAVYLSKYLSYLNAFFSIFKGDALQVSFYKSDSFKKAIDRLLPSHDLVFSHLLRVACYVQNIKKPVVVEMTDALSMTYSRSSSIQEKFSFRRFIYQIESSRILKLEKSAPRLYDLISFVSSVDSKFIYSSFTPKNLIICGNGVDCKKLPYNFCEKPSRVIGFIGNMYSFQNQEAAFWFATDVLPLLQIYGNFNFRIIGQISSKVRKKFEKLSNVELTGKVTSVNDSIADCFVAVCPVRIGAGVQNKLLEYMALGVPSISTSIGLEGLAAVNGRDLLIADNNVDMCEKIHYLWNNINVAEDLAINARKYVENHHSWSNQLLPLIDRIKFLLSNRST